MRHSWVIQAADILTLTLLSAPHYAAANIHSHDNDDGLFRFVSRPEIRAPKWHVNITEPDLVTPGYWFVAPFEFIEQSEPGNGWIAPHIYDGNGDLVWSGVHLSHNMDAIDFKRSNVRGEDRLTFLEHNEGIGYIMDETFEVKEQVFLGHIRLDFNSHEFYFIDNGTRAISMTDGPEKATYEQALAVGWDKEKPCRASFNGFKVWDTATWEMLWEWSTRDHVGLNESTYHEQDCGDSWGWDFTHLNAVDIDQNGDYYVSARHSDTIYKVSKYDGHVIWRLTGRDEPWGDFDMGDVRFRRQHNVRFRGFNGTHEIITLLDNGKGNDKEEPSFRHSRALTLALDTQSPHMTARHLLVVNHPDGDGAFAFRRGNYQILPNDNLWIGWSEQALHSEHTPDGKLIMTARLQTHWLGTYRSYKFPLIGRPSGRPTAAAAVYVSKARNSTTTLIHVSWNGATEIQSWKFYKTTGAGHLVVPIGQKLKTGFETAWAWDGYAEYIISEAIDANGNVLGRSDVTTVEQGSPVATMVGAADAEQEYWRNVESAQRSIFATHGSAGGPLVTFIVGGVCGLLVIGIARFANRKLHHRAKGFGKEWLVAKTWKE